MQTTEPSKFTGWALINVETRQIIRKAAILHRQYETSSCSHLPVPYIIQLRLMYANKRFAYFTLNLAL